MIYNLICLRAVVDITLVITWMFQLIQVCHISNALYGSGEGIVWLNKIPHVIIYIIVTHSKEKLGASVPEHNYTVHNTTIMHTVNK